MKKTLRFYTQEEKNKIKEFALTGKPVKGLIEDFCKKYDRSFHSVALQVYGLRKKLNIPSNVKGRPRIKKELVKSPKANLQTTVKDQSVVNMGRGEFNIPIKSWSITHHTDGFYFNVKF